MPPGTPPNNQFDFINNAGQQPKKPALALPANGSRGQRLTIFAGLIGLIVVFLIFIMAIMGRGNEDKAQFVNVVQQQSELIRVAGLGATEQAANSDIKNTAMNIDVIVSSDKQSLVTALAEKNMELKGKDLAGIPNEETTKLLTDAKAAANFDSTLITTLKEHLASYQSTLEQSFNKAKSQTLKDNLSLAFQHTELLQKQLEATRP